MKLIVISGLSGAGKGVAIHALEDLGYYCVDNLPLSLLPALADDMLARGEQRPSERIGAVIDARSPGAGFARFGEVMAEVEGKGIDAEVVFVEADDGVLIKRFSETRRRHPLTGDDVSLAEAIRRERDLLAPVREHADIFIDTTRTQLHQLRETIRLRVDRHSAGTLSLLFQSFGFKHGLPSDADMVFDARCLPNPHWEPELRELSGQSAEVAAFLERKPEVAQMLLDVVAFLTTWIPRFEADNRAYLTVAVGCTGGRHRSVYLVERLAEHFRRDHPGVMVRHREL